jgi:phosphatidylserine/phosphatidylglycerophosphate/cardiolipin synthase-like enzyme
MRATNTHGGLTVHAVAGTHTVLLGFDLAEPTGCLGFGIRRVDHTEEESYWLRGTKSFGSLVPQPEVGMDFSLRQHPVQGFQWGDYSAKPEHAYTYTVVARGGAPGALTTLAEVSVDVTTEAEDDGHHGVWFNRGVAGSQAFVKRFGQYTPPVDAGEDHPAFAWLSRGLGEAFRAFVDRAVDSEWGLRGAFYEFTWATGLDALAAAVARGVDVALVVHGRDSDSATGPDRDTTAADSRVAVTAAELDAVVTWRTAPNKGALQHNKFLVLTHAGTPIAVWTGSTNVTQGAVFGHLNVGHVIGDPAVSAQFLDYWVQLADQTHTTAALRTWTEQHDPVDLASPPPAGLTTIFSPRARSSTLLPWYATALAAATSSAHLTGAFGLHQVFRDELGVDRDVVRTVLLDRRPAADEPIPNTDPDVRISWGDELHHDLFDVWAKEHLTDFNKWVKFIHTKILLVDPLTDEPTVITGSANYSDSSTVDNEENSLVIRADAADGTEAAFVRRVADIYVTEYHRLFMHFVFRDRAERMSSDPSAARLVEDDSWSAPYYEAGGWRARQRQTFAGTLP